MRFFMPLFPFSEKAQLEIQHNDTDCVGINHNDSRARTDSASQILSVSPKTIGLSLSFGSIFNLLCAPVLAGPANSDAVADATSVADVLPVDNIVSHKTASDSLSGSLPNAPLARRMPLATLFQESTVSRLAAVSNTYSPLGAFSGSAHALSTPLPPSSPSSSSATATNTAAVAVVAQPDELLRSTAHLNSSNTQLSLQTVPSLSKSAQMLQGHGTLVADTSLESNVELIRLISHPALDHVSSTELLSGSTDVSPNTTLTDRSTNSSGLSNQDAAVGAGSAATSNRRPTPSTPNMVNDELGNLGVPLPTVDDAEDGVDLAQSSTSDRTVPDINNLLNGRQTGPQVDDELGKLRLQIQRSRTNEELGILRLRQTAQATPPPPKPPIAFLSGRIGFFDTDNVFRSNGMRSSRSNGQTLRRLDEQIFQAGLTVYAFPKLSKDTSLYAIAGTSLARYDNNRLITRVNQRTERPLLDQEGRPLERGVDYNQVELELGIRQRLFPRTYAQLGWRNQQLFTPGYKKKTFGINYIDAQLTHRSVLNSKTWLDSFYQARLGFAEPNRSSRFRQTFTFSLNHNLNKDLRTTLLYQLDLDDYTGMVRYDVYQQVLGVMSYRLTPESRLSVFGGTRFGSSSEPNVNLDDTFYGAGLNVSIPLF